MTFIPMFAMYLPARMFCTLAHTSSILMGAMTELETCFSHCSQTGFVTVDDFIALYTPSYVFYSHGCSKFLHARTFFTHFCNGFTCKNVLYTRPYVFDSHGCNKFLYARTFLTLADMTFIPMFAMYLPARMFCTLTLPWVQCQRLKPVLNQCSQTSFVSVDDFIALYTCSYFFYSHGCNKFLHARTFFTHAADTIDQFLQIPPILTVLTEVWLRANQAMVTNNLTVLTKISANQGFHVHKIKESKIELYFVKVFTEMIIYCNSFWQCFWCHKMLPCQMVLERKKMYTNSDYIIILLIV